MYWGAVWNLTTRTKKIHLSTGLLSQLWVISKEIYLHKFMLSLMKGDNYSLHECQYKLYNPNDLLNRSQLSPVCINIR